MFFKPLFWFCSALLIIAAESNAQYTLTMPYQRVSVDNSKGSAVFKGMPTYGKPGQPNLPLYSVTFLLPSGTTPKDVSVSIENPVDSLLPGTWYVAPAFPPVKGNQSASTGEYPKDMTVYGQSSFFPASWTGNVSFGKMRENQLVEIAINPCKYNPVTGEMKMLVGGVLTLSIASKAGVNSVAPASMNAPSRDSLTKKRLRELIVNPELLNDATPAGVQLQSSMTATAAPASSITYAIITTNAIAAASTKLNPYISYVQSAGYNVALAKETTWGGGTGDAAAEHIRAWLKNNYQTQNIQYVLLIGNPDPVKGDVPMKLAYPDQSAPGDMTGEAIPTDFYYAELTGNWDVNGDGHFGEYYDDYQANGADKYAEVQVGRIPYYGVITDLDKILQKTITYATSSSREWRKSVLLPMVPLDKITPNYYLGEQIKDNICNSLGINFYRIYSERLYATFPIEAGVVNMYPPPDAIQTTNANLLNAWTHNYFGLVTWSTHGTGGGADYIMTWPDAALLDDSHPSMTFEASCQNATPENNTNMAYSLLLNGAITTVAATRNAMYAPGQTDYSSSATVGGLAYSYTAGIFMGYSSGYAYDKAINMASDWGCSGWRNFLTMNIYGCPDITLNFPSDEPAAPTHLQVTSGDQNIFTLSWNDNATNETGYCIESATSANGPFTQINQVASNANVTLISANPGDKRYFRVRAVNGSTYSCYSNIDSGTTYHNLAQGKTVTYSSQQTSNEAVKAVDGSTTTRWAASSGTMPQWFEVDLGALQMTTEFDIVFELQGTTGDCNKFKIETSPDNATWTMQVDGTNNTNTAQTQFYSAYCTARYARITISHAPASHYASMYEFRAIGPSAPVAPVWVSSASALDNQLALKWQPAAGASWYDLKRSTVSGGPYVTVASGITGTTDTTINLIPGATYYFVLSAVNSAGHSFNSSEIVATSIATLPATPTNLSGSVQGNAINLYWTNNSSTESGISIERSSSATGPWSQIGWVNADSLPSYNDIGLPQGIYYYAVRAYNNSGYSAYSNVATVSSFMYTLKTSAANGTISLSPDGGTYVSGTSVYITVVPNSGYAFSSWSGDLTGITVPTTITMTGNKAITANFAPAAYQVLEAESATLSGPTVSSSYTGYTGTGYVQFKNDNNDYIEWTYNSPSAVPATLDFRFALADGSRPLMISVNGSNPTLLYFNATGSWTSWAYTGTVLATLAAGTNKIRATAVGANGAHIDNLRIMIPSTQPTTYTITASAGANGSISPSGSVKVNSGAGQTFTITPSANYAVSAVTVDGSNKGAVTTYPFTNVTANHTISATFALNLKIEAENATLSGGANKNTNHTGYSGTGFVDGYYNSTTAQVLFTVNAPTAGSYKATLHYSAGNGASSNTGLYVNGTKIKNISCAATANWNTWADEQETVTLKAGSNTIAYKAVTSSTASINLDYLTVSQ